MNNLIALRWATLFLMVITFGCTTGDADPPGGL